MATSNIHCQVMVAGRPLYIGNTLPSPSSLGRSKHYLERIYSSVTDMERFGE